MKITTVSVFKLFGIFDHVIPFKTPQHITIIHGPNGFGKTILLKMIQSLFNRNYDELADIPFKEFIVGFDNGTSIHVSTPPIISTEDKSSAHFIIDLYKGTNKINFAETWGIRAKDLHFPLDFIERAIPDLVRISPHKWFYMSS